MFYLRGFLLCVFFHLVTSKGFPFSDVAPAPPVEIEPSLLDWGEKRPYYPSLAYLTVKNTDSGGGVLSIYGPYSSSSQFYPCNFTATLLAPGETASMCFVFCPTNIGRSLAQLVLQTSFGGLLVRARGFALEPQPSYSVKPLGGIDSWSGEWRENLSSFNPFNEGLQSMVCEGRRLDSGVEHAWAGYNTRAPSGRRLDSGVGHARVDYNMLPPSVIKVTTDATTEADESLLKNQKSQVTENLNSGFGNNKVQSPVIQVLGTNTCPESIPNENLSGEPIIGSGILTIPTKVVAVILSAAAALVLIPIYRDFKMGKSWLDSPIGNPKQNDPLTENPSRAQSISPNSDPRDRLSISPNSDPRDRLSISPNSDPRDRLDSRNLTKVGINENKRRRRKKKSVRMNGSSVAPSPSLPTRPVTPNKQRVKRSDSPKPTPSKPNFIDDEESTASKFFSRAVLLPSATFPTANRATTPYLSPMSRIAPHVRAPGMKLCDLRDKIGVEEDLFTYDIWGDYLFGVSSSSRSKIAGGVGIENNWESFFVRDPQTHIMANSSDKTCSNSLI